MYIHTSKHNYKCHAYIHIYRSAFKTTYIEYIHAHTLYTYYIHTITFITVEEECIHDKEEVKLRGKDPRRCKGVIFNKTGLEILRYVCVLRLYYVWRVYHHLYYYSRTSQPLFCCSGRSSDICMVVKLFVVCSYSSGNGSSSSTSSSSSGGDSISHSERQ